MKLKTWKRGFSRRPGRKIKRKRREGGKITRVLEEGIIGRWILGAAIFWVSVLVISWRGMPIRLPTVGSLSERDVIATTDFSYPDRLRTEGEREAAVNRQPVAYRIDRSIPDEKISRARETVRRLAFPESSLPPGPTGLVFAAPARTLSSLFGVLYPPGRVEQVSAIIESAYRPGILAADIKKTLLNTRQEEIVVYDREGRTEILSSLAGHPSEESARSRAAAELREILPDAAGDFPEYMAAALIEANLVFDPEKTAELRNAARLSVPTVMTGVARGEKIIRQGEEVRPRHIQKLRSYQEALYRIQPPISLLYYTLGIGAVVLLLYLVAFFFLRRYHRAVLKSNSRLLLIATVIVLVLVFSRGLRQVAWILPPGLMESVRFLSPVAFGALLLALLIGVRLALFFTIILSFQTALIQGGGEGYLLVGMIGGMAAVLALNFARRRRDLFRAGGLAAGAGALAIAALGLAEGTAPGVLVSQAAGAAGSGILSALVALVALGVFEPLFRISSNIGLLELSDLNHPLLKTLMIRAPGTYHHSLMVATLAEGAAEAASANPLLARVSSYFHDIGKTVKPEYFSENEPPGISRHDDLIPSMSSLILIAHVKEGVALARRHKLDRRITAIIEQHHGTGLISYFYDRAERSLQLNFRLLEKEFRYPGPRPRTREAAIVMLADAVEAASVALDRPTPVRLEALVREIIGQRFTDGQLDECDLTLTHLKKIEETLIRILSARYHTRVKYPEGNGKKNREGS
ncbi:MAG: HDIG domain-containing protein [Candidatus Erginobacter occultus]|nr:HDIG domain-containing protein [Candidatus Erginobacter occultus]